MGNAYLNEVGLRGREDGTDRQTALSTKFGLNENRTRLVTRMGYKLKEIIACFWANGNKAVKRD